MSYDEIKLWVVLHAEVKQFSRVLPSWRVSITWPDGKETVTYMDTIELGYKSLAHYIRLHPEYHHLCSN